MAFDRYTAVTPSLLELLRHAAALRGVLLTEPVRPRHSNPRPVCGVVESGARYNLGPRPVCGVVVAAARAFEPWLRIARSSLG